MHPIEENEALRQEIEKIREVAGYLWERGWAERNGGNISVNLTALITPEIDALPPLSEEIPLNRTLPTLASNTFYVTGTGRRMRYVARNPYEHGTLIRINPAGNGYWILGPQSVTPTCELVSHLSMHYFMRTTRKEDTHVVLHTHPTELIGMTHNPEFLKPGVLGETLWSMIPECRLIVPKGIGIVPYHHPGTTALADATLEALRNHDVVMWEKHGILCVHQDIIEAFDAIDALTQAAKIYMNAKHTGCEPQGMSKEQLDDLAQLFGV